MVNFDRGKAAVKELAMSADNDQSSTVGSFLVSQGQSRQVEGPGEYLWAPAPGAAGRRSPYRETIRDVVRGDLVIHYASGEFWGVSTAVTHAYPAPSPTAEHEARWDDSQGALMVRVKTYELDEPMKLEDIPLETRKASTLFNVHGGAQERYLQQMDQAFARWLVDALGVVPPDVSDRPEEEYVGSVPPPNPSTRPATRETAICRIHGLEVRSHLVDEAGICVDCPGYSGPVNDVA